MDLRVGLPEPWRDGADMGCANRHTLKGHSCWVITVVFSPDGSRVASSSYDETVRVWDVVQATELVRQQTKTYSPVTTFSDDSMKPVGDGQQPLRSFGRSLQSSRRSWGLRRWPKIGCRVAS